MGVTVKLKYGHSNNTLNSKGIDRKIDQCISLKAESENNFTENAAEMEKLISSLHKIQEEDPTLQVLQSTETKGNILSGQGQLHLDLVKIPFRKRIWRKMEMKNPKVLTAETITGKSRCRLPSQKQSGGAGQFGEIHMRVENYYEGMPETRRFQH